MVSQSLKAALLTLGVGLGLGALYWSSRGTPSALERASVAAQTARGASNAAPATLQVAAEAPGSEAQLTLNPGAGPASAALSAAPQTESSRAAAEAVRAGQLRLFGPDGAPLEGALLSAHLWEPDVYGAFPDTLSNRALWSLATRSANLAARSRLAQSDAQGWLQLAETFELRDPEQDFEFCWVTSPGCQASLFQRAVGESWPSSLRLSPARAGQVTVLANGAPLAGARIWAQALPDAAIGAGSLAGEALMRRALARQMLSDASGRALLPDLAGPMLVWAEAEGQRSLPVELEAPGVLTLELLPEVALSARAISRDGSSLGPWALLSAEALIVGEERLSGIWLGSALSQDGSNFGPINLPRLPAGQEYRLRLWQGGNREWNARLSAPAENRWFLEIPFERGVDLAVFPLEIESGEPLPGALVSARPSRGAPGATIERQADGDGIALLVGLAAEQSYDISASAPGRAPRTIVGVSVPPGESSSAFDLPLAAAAELRGRVLLDGQPVEDFVLVHSTPVLGQFARKPQSAAKDGRFVLADLPAGAMQILAEIPAVGLTPVVRIHLLAPEVAEEATEIAAHSAHNVDSLHALTLEAPVADSIAAATTPAANPTIPAGAAGPGLNSTGGDAADAATAASTVNQEITLELTRGWPGRGLLLDGNTGEPIVAAQFELLSGVADRPRASLALDVALSSEGRFEIERLHPDANNLRITADGYRATVVSPTEFSPAASGSAAATQAPEEFDFGNVLLFRAATLNVQLRGAADPTRYRLALGFRPRGAWVDFDSTGLAALPLDFAAHELCLRHPSGIEDLFALELEGNGPFGLELFVDEQHFLELVPSGPGAPEAAANSGEALDLSLDGSLARAAWEREHVTAANLEPLGVSGVVSAAAPSGEGQSSASLTDNQLASSASVATLGYSPGASGTSAEFEQSTSQWQRSNAAESGRGAVDGLTSNPTRQDSDSGTSPAAFDPRADLLDVWIKFNDPLGRRGLRLVAITDRARPTRLPGLPTSALHLQWTYGSPAQAGLASVALSGARLERIELPLGSLCWPLRLVDASGRALPGHELHVYQQLGQEPPKFLSLRQTDQDGLCLLPAAPSGNLLLTVISPSGAVLPDQRLTASDFGLQPEISSFGQAPGSVAAFSAGNKANAADGEDSSRINNGSPDLRNGSQDVSNGSLDASNATSAVSSSSFALSNGITHHPHALFSGQPRLHTLTFAPGEALHLHLFDEDGPLSGATLEWSTSQGQLPLGNLSSDPSGTSQRSHLGPGHYLVLVSAPDHWPLELDLHLPDALIGREPLSLRLPRIVEFQQQLFDASGQPLANHPVELLVPDLPPQAHLQAWPPTDLQTDPLGHLGPFAAPSGTRVQY